LKGSDHCPVLIEIDEAKLEMIVLAFFAIPILEIVLSLGLIQNFGFWKRVFRVVAADDSRSWLA
jgi:nitrate reductase NapE component